MINISALKSDESKKETYTMLVLYFNQVGTMCLNKIGGWKITESFTDTENQEYITVYSNGLLEVKAHSIKDNHRYSVKSIKEN